MRTIIYCMSLFLVPVFALAQQATFKGKISAEGKPVLGADVILRKGQEVKGTSSQASGDYQVKVPAGLQAYHFFSRIQDYYSGHFLN